MKNSAKQLSNETISAIFIIAFGAFFSLSNLLIGFSWPLYLATIPVAALIAFFHPRSGLYAGLFLTFVFERFFTLAPIVIGRAEYKFYPLDALLLAIIAGTLFQLISKKVRFHFRKVDGLLVGFSALTLIYFLFSFLNAESDFALAFSSFKNYAFYSLLYFLLLINIDSREHLRRLAKFVFAGAVGIIFFIFYGALSGVGLWTEYTPLSTAGVRILAFTHAFYLALAFLGLVAYALFQKTNTTPYSGLSSGYYRVFRVLMIVWLVGIAGSMMRHLWISLAFALAAIFWLLPTERRLKLVKIAGSFFLVFLVLAALVFYAALFFDDSGLGKNVIEISSSLGERFFSITNTSDESIFWRNIVWKEAAREYLESPVTGVGLGKKFFVESGSYMDFVEVRNIHNSWLVIFVQMGLAGLGLVAGLFVAIARKLAKKVLPDNELEALRFSLLAILFFQLVAFMFQPYLEANLLGIFFWIALGLARILAYENIRD